MRVGPAVRPPVDLDTGDLVTFAADVPHVYEALEDGARGAAHVLPLSGAATGG